MGCSLGREYKLSRGRRLVFMRLCSGLSIPLLGLSYSILVSLGLLQKSCFGKKELAIDFLWSISHHHSVKIPDLRG